MYECEECEEEFWDLSDLEDHLNDFDHWAECETCNSVFRMQRSCNQHMDSLDHWAPRYECETCNKEFLSEHAARQHMTDKRHWTPKIPCETCSKMFRTQGAANQHMNDLGHWAPSIECETCTAKFPTQEKANQHMKALGHYENYCRDCDIKFQNENNLRMHLNSRIHRGTSVTCPFCKSGYTAASGLTHHLERGSCPNAPQLNRESILRMVRERDPHGAITKKAITYHEEHVEYSATDYAFNGDAWECYICHREFNKRGSLDQHLNSPVHQQAVYRCPNNRSRCGKEFSTLAALFGHLESEACGFMRFEKVQKQVGNVLTGRKLIGFN